MSLAEENKTDVAELTVIDPNLEVKMIIETLVLAECGPKLNIQLDEKTQSIINKVLKISPGFLSEIETVFIEIVKDNKIDSNDIPNLITLVQKIYELIYKAKEVHLDSKKTAEFCGSLLKFMVRKLVEERKIKKEYLSDILKKTYCFFQYYNNNYRHIYHVENYLLNLAKIIHEL